MLLERRILHRVAVTVLAHAGPDHRTAPHVVTEGQPWHSALDERRYEAAQVQHHRRMRLRGYVGHPCTPPGMLVLPEDCGATTLLWEKLERDLAESAAPVEAAVPAPVYQVTLANAPAAVMRLIGEASRGERTPPVALQGWTRLPGGIDGPHESGLAWLSTLMPALTLPHFAWYPDDEGGEMPYLRWIARGWEGRLDLPYGAALPDTGGPIVCTGALPSPDTAARPRSA